MTISRMQEPRQLYGLGSLVKKITKPIKKIGKSPIGKAALAGAALYGLGGAKFLGGEGIFASGQGMSRFGNLLNFFKLYSWSFVFESIKVTIDLSIKGSQKFKINFSDDFKPPSIYMAPTIASKQSLIILSVDLSKFL